MLSEGGTNLRTLNEIVEDVIAGKMPSHEECFWALQAYRYMLNMEHRTLRNELMKEKRAPEFIRSEMAKQSFQMYKNALAQAPDVWCGKK